MKKRRDISIIRILAVALLTILTMSLSACATVTVQRESDPEAKTLEPPVDSGEETGDEDIADEDDVNEASADEAVSDEDTDDEEISEEDMPDIEVRNKILPLPAMKAPADGEALRTLMIYIVGADLESGNEQSGGGFATEDLIEMANAEVPDNVNVVIECGGAKDWKNNLVPDGEVSRYLLEDHKFTTLQKLGRTSMTRQGDLEDFIEYCSDNYPAANYTLILWDHGGGTPVGFGMDELDNKVRYTDGSTSGWMYCYEIGKEIERAGVHFDAVIFDACNMCTLEMAKSLEGKADMMNGAESRVSGIGINYTNLLDILDHRAMDLCEQAAKDYISAIHSKGFSGSMSTIRLDYVDELYDSYVAYIKSIADKVESQDGYVEYCKSRSNCMSDDGEYRGLDSIDLMTLAVNYRSKASSKLMNWVSNSVVYTDSDYEFGHGLLVYSPFNDIGQYDFGRTSFTALGYDPDVIRFYDRLMSRRLAYEGTDAVRKYAGEWYVRDYEPDATEAEEVAQENSEGTTEGGNLVDQSGGKVYKLATEQTENGYYAVSISDEADSIINTVEMELMLDSKVDNSRLRFIIGKDYFYRKDSKNRLALVAPSKWLTVDNLICPFFATDYHRDTETGKVATAGYILCEVNGKESHVYFYIDDANPNGLMRGYVPVDPRTKEEVSEGYYFEDGDVLQTMAYFFEDDKPLESSVIGDKVKAKDFRLKMLEGAFDGHKLYGRYVITDVYGNKYVTDARELGRMK
ncbi:MAG: hypothetical protein IKO16_01760 [Lachnospiraceae bacterium]|nr:hypothetical protein [Lachnospiraceae bacterium]